MEYDALVAKVIELLQREKRVPYRSLKRRFDLDDDSIEDLKVDEREPLSYTPKHLAEKILTSRSALEGKRQQVTVLFCDLANSTPLEDEKLRSTLPV
jgi:class 3 adenylate cyclase